MFDFCLCQWHTKKGQSELAFLRIECSIQWILWYMHQPLYISFILIMLKLFFQWETNYVRHISLWKISSRKSRNVYSFHIYHKVKYFSFVKLLIFSICRTEVKLKKFEGFFRSTSILDAYELLAVQHTLLTGMYNECSVWSRFAE